MTLDLNNICKVFVGSTLVVDQEPGKFHGAYI